MLTKTQTTEYTIPISEILSLRLHSDTRPKIHHIANLQKGLIFVYHGTELVGEGTGFGVPVARYRNKTYFPGSSTVQILQKDEQTTVVKQFTLNMVFERRLGKAKIENKITHKFTRLVAELYEGHKYWRPVFQQRLSTHIGLKTSFVQVKPAGKVAVTYRIDPPCIHVETDLKLLKRSNLQRIFVLNEQGSRHFRKYTDSNGTVWFDKHIGAWDKVQAKWACISSGSGEIGFRLWKVEDAILRRGREFFEGTLDWVGLDYEVSPKKTCFEYDIEILGSPKQK